MYSVHKIPFVSKWCWKETFKKSFLLIKRQKKRRQRPASKVVFIPLSHVCHSMTVMVYVLKLDVPLPPSFCSGMRTHSNRYVFKLAKKPVMWNHLFYDQEWLQPVTLMNVCVPLSSRKYGSENMLGEAIKKKEEGKSTAPCWEGAVLEWRRCSERRT